MPYEKWVWYCTAKKQAEHIALDARTSKIVFLGTLHPLNFFINGSCYLFDMVWFFEKKKTTLLYLFYLLPYLTKAF